MNKAAGPLRGVKVLEFAGLGPAPFCCMLLSDLGADVLRIDRPGATYDRHDVLYRGRRSLVLDLKNEADRRTALALAEKADVLVEGFRPGVMERLGLGADAVLSRNPRLVYGRMTGWGQTGPLAPLAGHDVVYLALTGALHAIGPRERPVPPLNLIADFGGGALYLVVGILSALLHARASGEGQTIDCAMTDGSVSLLALQYGLHAGGDWKDARESNFLDGAAPDYNVYRCADGGFLAVSAMEQKFWDTLLAKLGVDAADFGDREDESLWPAQRARLAAAFATRSRDEWCALFDGVDCCVAPVLSLAEAPAHPHHVARGAFSTVDGVVQPSPAPKFSRTPGAIQSGPLPAGTGGEEALVDWGVLPRRS